MVFEKLKEILAHLLAEQNVDVEQIGPDTVLQEQLYLDSITILMIGIMIESAFDIVIETEALAGFKKVEDVVRYIEQKQRAK
jgi:acyl carrier protein